ncbi:hypothetical protein V2J09_008532 [Rumex salicifolius]
MKNPQQYRRLVGKLINLTITRPDITYAIQFMQMFCVQHWKGAKHLLIYLLDFTRSRIIAKILHALCDANCQSCPMTRRSIIGFCVLLENYVVPWRIKQHSFVAMAIPSTSCAVTWLLGLLRDLGRPVEFHSDNEATIHIIKNPIFNKRTKHIEADYHLLVHKYINTREKPVDMLTKVLSMDQSQKCLVKIGVVNQFYHMLEGE